MADLTTFAKRLRDSREQAGLTQDELAKKIGVTKASISSYENQGENSKKPALDKVMELAQALDVSLDWLCGVDRDNLVFTDFNLEVYLKSLVIAITEITSNVIELENKSDGGIIGIEITNSKIAKFVNKVRDLLKLYREGTLTKSLYETCVDKLISDYYEYCIFCDKFMNHRAACEAETHLLNIIDDVRNEPGNFSGGVLTIKNEGEDTRLFLSEEYLKSLE